MYYVLDLKILKIFSLKSLRLMMLQMSKLWFIYLNTTAHTGVLRAKLRYLNRINSFFYIFQQVWHI